MKSHVIKFVLSFLQVIVASEDGTVLSNPLPFIVYIESPEDDGSYPTVPAVFAGVLVLFVVFLALFIPLVTRAKRRFRQGKPMFKVCVFYISRVHKNIETDSQCIVTV